MNASDNHFVMAPGVYTIDASGVSAGKYGNPFMLISGENNIWDFNDVTFEVNTNFYRAHGNNAVQVLFVTGKNNYIKGLTIRDVGDRPPRKGSQLVKVHGIDNTLDACTIMAKGSKPYGYGDMMGKGTGNLTPTTKKSSLQIGGERISILDCAVISRSFGHGIFMQGAIDTLIQGTYVEGELRKTSDILAETSGPAYDVGFVNKWDQPNQIQPGWTLSCQEDGIRAYTSGTPFGYSSARQTRNIHVIDCTVVKMRTGVSINLAKGTKYIEGCVVLDVGRTGYRPGENSTIVNCSGNATYAALLDLTGSGKPAKNVTADLTLIPHDQPDANPLIAYIIGSGHTINIHNGGIGLPYTDQKILVGGARRTWRHPEGEVVNPAKNLTFNNYTGYPVVLTSTTENCQVNSVGDVEDSGSGNIISSISGTTVTASSHVGLKVPRHTIDGDLTGTHNYWDSDEGIGAWIRYDLGQEKTIRSISVLWQDGLLYTYDFELQVSYDSVEWTTVFTGSSLQTGTMETYEFESSSGLYIRLINNGSTHGENYIQIRELNADIEL
ncbi:MAG: discoidin domain-containing protein [Planctomycetota bacterium]